MTSLPKVSRFIQEWLNHLDVYDNDLEQQYLIELAVLEACTNIIRYAYPSASRGRFGVCLRHSEQKVEILILDEGLPFDPLQSCSPDIDVHQEGGYGIFLINKIMDEMQYQRRGSRWNHLLLMHRPAESQNPGKSVNRKDG